MIRIHWPTSGKYSNLEGWGIEITGTWAKVLSPERGFRITQSNTDRMRILLIMFHESKNLWGSLDSSSRNPMQSNVVSDQKQ